MVSMGLKCVCYKTFFRTHELSAYIYVYVCGCVLSCSFEPFMILFFFIRLHTTAKAVSEAEYSSYGATKQGGQVSQV